MSKQTVANMSDEVNELLEMNQIFDMEGISNVVDFFEKITDLINAPLDWIRNYHETADIATPQSPEGFFRDLEKVGYAGLADITIYRASNINATQYEFAKLLSEQCGMMSDIERRLYTPIEEWAAYADAMDNFHNKPFNSRDLKFLDIKSMAKDMAKMYESKGYKEDGSETVKFMSQYRSLKEFGKAYEDLANAHQHLQMINLEHIKQREIKIVKSISNVLREIESGAKEEMTKPALKQLANYLRALAEETEQMVALAFVTNASIIAWNETMVTLKEVVE